MYPNTKNLLFFDIETIAKCKFDDLTDKEKQIWLYRYHQKYYELAMKQETACRISGKEFGFEVGDLDDSTTIGNIFLKYTPLVAEYSKVICISIGLFDETNKPDLMSIYNEDEAKILKEFKLALSRLTGYTLSGYNIASYDIPYLVKRFYINNLKVPKEINFIGKKPWEVNVKDLMVDWKGLMWENVALEVLTESLGLGNSKDGEVNGELLSLYYYNGKIKSLKQIANYCEADVKQTMVAIQRLNSVA